MVSWEFLLLLSSVVLLSSLFFQARFTQGRARQLSVARIGYFGQPRRTAWGSRPLNLQRRPLRKISFEEFRELLQQKSGNLVVLDLRSEAQANPFPFPEACVLPVRPEELGEILGWMPHSQCTVFYGIRNPWLSALERSSSRAGSAPFYLLDDGTSRRGTA